MEEKAVLLRFFIIVFLFDISPSYFGISPSYFGSGFGEFFSLSLQHSFGDGST